MKNLTFANGCIVTPNGLLDRGQVTVLEGIITEVRESAAVDEKSATNTAIGAIDNDLHGAGTSIDVIDLQGDYLLPGFVDVQVNGGGGLLFNDDPSVATASRIAAAHRAFGTTSLLPTLISDDLAKVEQAISAIDEAVAGDAPGIAGVHIEGPFLNVEKKGIHDASKLRPLCDDAVAILTSARHAQVVVTLAPECARIEQIERLVEAGVKVCIGHSNASFDETRAALRAGVSGFTHLFNAMPLMQSRAPGIIPAALESSAWCGVIVDGKHVHPAMLRLAWRGKSDRRLMLVTDAMPIVGADTDHFFLGGQRINVADGACQSAEGTLAGAALTMIDALRNALEMLQLDLEQASRMASHNPCAFLGIADHLGAIAPGLRADLLRVSPELEIRQIWMAGLEQKIQQRAGQGIEQRAGQQNHRLAATA